MELEKRKIPVNRVVSSDEDLVVVGMNGARDQFAESVDAPQVEKSAQFVGYIESINREMAIFLRGYNCESVSFPSERIVMPDMDRLPENQKKLLQSRKESKVGGYWVPNEQTIVMLMQENLSNTAKGALFLQTIIHEMMHPNSFQSRTMKMIVEEKDGGGDDILKLTRKDIETGRLFYEDYVAAVRRVGLNIFIEGRDRSLFERLDEAVITELQIRFFYERGRSIPELAPMVEEIESAIDSWVKNDPNIDVFQAKRELNFSLTTPLPGVDQYEYSWATQWPYKKERRDLWLLIDEIYVANKQNFTDREDVFRVFTDAVLNGRLLPLARLVEGHYGKGSFRYLGEQASF